MLLKHVCDPFYICLCLVILVFQIFNFICLFFKKSEKSLFFFRIKILQLTYHVCEKFPHFPKILSSYIFQRLIRKIRHFFLGSGSVLKNLRRIFHINLFCKGIHHLLFLRSQFHPGHFLLYRIHIRSLLHKSGRIFRLFRSFRFQLRLQCEKRH